MQPIIPRRKTSICAIFCLVTFFLSACDSESTQENSVEEKPAKPAKLLTVGQLAQDDYLNFPAVIQSTQSSALAFQVGGVLQAVLVVEAQAIEKGQVLARLDQRDYLAKLQSAEAQFKNAETEYQRAERLIKEQAISRSILEQRKSQYDVSKAQLDTAQKALEDTVLIAPFSGNVSTVSIEDLENVQAGEAVITVLGNGGLEAKAALPSNIVARAQKDNEQSNSAYVILDADKELRIPAKFKSVVLEADSASQTFEVVFAFEAPDNLNVLPGMNATLWFKNPDRSQSGIKAISVPLAAISTDGDEKFVWVVDSSSMIVSKRKVVIQPGVGSHLNILSGLQAEETIVAAGVSQLSEGMKVRPWSK